ncbi:MAG: hypothetical protein ABWW69_03760, partial [Pyrodictiaceae archaeon]
MSDPDIVIAGAGPAGLLVARWIRSSDVLLVERSAKPGYPPHCTGLVSPRTARLIGYPEAVGEEYECAVFLDEGFRERCRICGSPLAVRVRRPLLEELLAGDVEAQGHRILYSTRLVGFREGKVVLASRSKHSSVTPSRLILAVGAQGLKLADHLLGSHYCERLVGLEVRVRLSHRPAGVSPDSFYTIHCSRFSPEMFAWLVPLEYGRELLIGLASSSYQLDRLS